MSKKLCFIIENRNLYLEQSLVDYMDIPIFFLCKGEDQYYLVLCVDIEELRYIVTKLSLSDTYNLLHGNVPMRDVILKQSEYWMIHSGDEIDFDMVKKYKMDMLELSLLPEKDACFKILTKEMREFVQRFDQDFFADRYFFESNNKVDFNEAIEDELFDGLFGNIEKYVELINYKIKKESSSDNLIYDELMKRIKTEETMFENFKVSFNLNELTVNNMAAAA